MVRFNETLLLRATVLVVGIVLGTPELGANGNNPPSAYPWLLGGPQGTPYTMATGGSGFAKCSIVQGLPNYWVNTDSLNLAVEDTDFRVGGLGPELLLTRTYNLDPAQKGRFGNGWTSTYETRVVQSAGLTGAVTLTKGSGQRFAYTYTSSSTTGGTQTTQYAPPIGRFDTLTAITSGGTTYYLLRDKASRHVYRYDTDPTLAGSFRLSSITDRNGNALTLAYNADGTLGSVTDATGRKASFAYTAQKLCSSVTTPDGGTVRYSYDANGFLTGNVDLLGTTIAYTYGAAGTAENSPTFMKSMAASGKTIAFTYAVVGNGYRLATVTDANGNTEEYAGGQGFVGRYWQQTPLLRNLYDTFDYATVNDSVSGQTTWWYRQDFSTNQSFSEWLIDYGANRLPTVRTDVLLSYTDRQNQSRFTWDARGNLTQLTDANGGATRLAYDADDNLLTFTNPKNEVWSFAYDAKGNVTAITAPGGGKTAFSYDTRGNLLGVADAGGRTTSFAYDPARQFNLASITDPLGNAYTMTYDAAGINLTGITDPNKRTTGFAYDANRRLTRTTFADGSVRSIGYDALAPVSVTDENGRTRQFKRDGRLDVVEVVDPLGQAVKYTRDRDGRAVSRVGPLGSTEAYTYDFLTDRLARVTDPLGGTVDFTRDRNANLATLTDERRNVTSFTYDQFDQVTQVVDPLRNTAKVTYDALQRPSTVTNARGGVVGYTYDANGRLTGKSHNGASVATFGYDAVGNLTTVVDATGTTTYAYDAARRRTGITYGDGKELRTAYDGAGNPTTISYPGPLQVTYVHDARNRVGRVAWSGYSVDFAYDPAGNLLTETRSNGVTSRYGYDAAGRQTAVSHKKDATVIAEIAYGRDAAGRITDESGTYPLQPAFVSTSVSGSYNAANGITTWAGDGYTYDADGNLTAIAGSRSTTATYDVENRPVSLTRNGRATTYVYDGLGRRASAQVDGVVRRFHHDAAGRLLFETDGTGQVTAIYIYAGKRLIASGTGAGSTFVFHHADKTGSTLALTDATGAVVGAFAYSPYGELQGSAGTVDTPFKYVGSFGVMDEGGGIYFMKNRYYDAVTGRFLQRDPIGFAGGQTNLYAYVGGNPVDRIDPSGLAVAFAEPGSSSEAAARIFWGLARLGKVMGGSDGLDAARVYSAFAEDQQRRAAAIGFSESEFATLAISTFSKWQGRNTVADEVERGEITDKAWMGAASELAYIITALEKLNALAKSLGMKVSCKF